MLNVKRTNVCIFSKIITAKIFTMYEHCKVLLNPNPQPERTGIRDNWIFSFHTGRSSNYLGQETKKYSVYLDF